MSFEIEEVIERAETILKDAQKMSDEGNVGFFQISDIGARSAHLITTITGSKSTYSETIKHAQKEKLAPTAKFASVVGVLQAFYFDAVNGRLPNIRHEVEVVVVSEIITQSKKLLKTKGIHPAASIIICCAGLEEFLRSWCEEKGINIPEKQKSLSKYALELRKAKYLALPEERRIQSWADYRNDAAHGDRWSSIDTTIASTLVNEVEAFIVKHKEVLG